MTTLSSIRRTIDLATGVGITTYATAAELPTTGLTAGDQAFITSTGRLYISNTNGWYNIALINQAPYWIEQPDGSYALSTTGLSTVITILAGDSDSTAPSYTATADSDFNQIATITTDSEGADGTRFIVTPIDSENGTAIAGSGTVTFIATDGINQASVVSTFSLSFAPDWSTASVTESKLTASDAQAYDNFGACAISGDGAYAIVGAEGEDTNGSSAGAAYIYVRSGSSWSQQARIVGSYMAQNGYFGIGVDINSDGTYAVVGAGGAGDSSVYVFTRSGSTWTQQAKLNTASGGGTIGGEVSINSDGTYIAISNISHNSGVGAVHVFTRSGSTWTEQATLTASPALPAGSNTFGKPSINSDGTYIVVGSGLEDAGTGAAYVFTRSGSTWTQQQKIQSSDIQNGDNFGYAGVTINGDATTIAIGAAGEDGDGNAQPNSGAAYVFTRSGSTWTQQAKLKESSIVDYAQFGWSLKLSNDGNILVASAWAFNSLTGRSEVFNRSGSTWSSAKLLTASDAATGDRFGWHSDISETGKYIIIGAAYANAPAEDSGAAYIYEAG